MTSINENSSIIFAVYLSYMAQLIIQNLDNIRSHYDNELKYQPHVYKYNQKYYQKMAILYSTYQSRRKSVEMMSGVL